jgi:hypothetical protein
MATKRDLIESALEEFGINSSFDIAPEELQRGLTRLNRIAAQWDGLGVRVGFNLGGGLDDDAGIPDTAQDAFAAALSVRWAGSFGKTVSNDTKKAAAQGFNALYTARGVLPQTPMPPNMPVGRGSRRGVLSPQYYPPTSEVPGLNDGATEY